MMFTEPKKGVAIGATIVHWIYSGTHFLTNPDLHGDTCHTQLTSASVVLALVLQHKEKKTKMSS